MRKIPRKYTTICLAVGMSLCMSFVMSGALTAVNLGVSRATAELWLTHNFPVAFLIALPVALIALPLVRRLVAALTE